MGDRSTTDPGRRSRVAVVVAVLATLIYTAGVSLHPGGTSRWTAFDDIGQAITPCIAAAACWVTARRTGGRERVAWILMGAGTAAWAAGEVIWTVYEVGLGHQPVSPSTSDVGYLLAPVLIIAGLLLFVDTPAGPLSRWRGASEGLLLAGGVLIAAWIVMLAPVVRASTDALTEQLVSLAYPVLDAVAIAAVLFVATRHRRHVYGRLWVLALGIVALAVSDTSYWYLTSVKSFDSVNPTDAGWFAGFLIVAFGAALRRHRSAEPTTHDAQANARLFHRSRVVVAIPELVALAGLTVAAGHSLLVTGGRVDGALTWMIAGVAVLGLAHGLLVVVENHALTASLEDRVAARTHELEGRERHFAALVERSSDITAVISPDLVIESITDGIRSVYGWTPESLAGHRLGEFGDRFEALIESLTASVDAHGQVREVDWELVDGTGRQRFAQSKITNLIDDPDVGGYVVNTRDVTDQALLEGELRHQAFHDQLCGLANRALFNDRAQHALSRGRRSGRRVAVMVIDLDGFKDVNDSLGHSIGDLLLRTVADHILEAVRPEDTVARLGGDEFAVLMEDLDGSAEAMSTAEDICARLRDASWMDNGGVCVTASIGVATSESPASSIKELLRDADIAMYSAKNHGKDGVRLFESWMSDRARERFQLQSEMTGALERDEFMLYYQPAYELRSGTIEGFEALLRWKHRGLGVVPPDQFIPLAEETGLIVPLGRWVLQEATRQLGAWSRGLADGGALTMAVNVSARQIRDWRLPDDVRDAIAAAGVSPQRIVLEVTESMLVQDPTEVANVLRSLKALGVRVAIDDFGTGYSSLAYLKDLPIDILKVDKAFVSPEDQSTDGEKLLGAILTLAQTLGLRTIAEGVEQQEQADLLLQAGCDIGQGFLWSRPLTADDAWKLLTSADGGARATARGDADVV